MVRTLAIDFGERRIGLAISDEEGRIAMPLETVARTSDAQAMQAIAAIADREHAQALVVGEPVNMDGSRGPAAARCRGFAGRLAAHTGLAVEMANETLTTVEALERLRAAGGDPRRDAARLDALAAQVLLEDVLTRRQRAQGLAR